MRSTHPHLAANRDNGLTAGVALEKHAFARGQGGERHIDGAHHEFLQGEHAAMGIVGMAPVGEPEHAGELDQGRVPQPHGAVEIPQDYVRLPRSSLLVTSVSALAGATADPKGVVRLPRPSVRIPSGRALRASTLRQRLVPYVRRNVVHPSPVRHISIQPLDTIRTVAAGLVGLGSFALCRTVPRCPTSCAVSSQATIS